MTKQARTILFVSITALFFLMAPLIIFYSQGYRFDFKTKKIFQTGAFSFKAWPQEAWISIDNKLVKKTDFFFGTVYIENILPKEYRVKIEKEGYLPWKKTLEIKEKWVTENKNIFLVPENPRFNLLEEGGDNFFLSPDGKKGILKKDEKDGWALILLDFEKNISSSLFQEKDFSEKDKNTDFITLEWSSDSKRFLLKNKAGKNQYFVIEVENEPNIFPLDFLSMNLSDAVFHPRDPQVILLTQNLTKEDNLFSVNYKEKSLSGPILSGFLALKAFDNSLFWLDEEGFLRQSNLSSNEIRQLNKKPLSLNPDSQYELFTFANDKIFLKEDDDFYFLNQDRQSLEMISGRIKGARISPDSKKIVYFTDNEIWVLFLENIEEQPRRKNGEKLFLTRFSEEIGDAFWWTSHYLVFSVGDKIKITEIDDRDRINIYDLVIFKNPEIFWNKYDKKLYVLSEGKIFISEQLIP
ncbi:MAG TPA: hypothetical protein ENI19_01270 [Candidatus Nealsonbacteria bacterium]|uniref:PEGA domain-containing protein n=1 Tax=marine sediment metagenome TaxID=412755 RepID=A0A0F9VFV6_9ZZZZ|nr:hypothetical protein [Candidatus Nealsonbacteria bacterium]HEB46322.1 hypothetical protein [Candidatus Nealsonbacteria bacterium]